MGMHNAYFLYSIQFFDSATCGTFLLLSSLGWFCGALRVEEIFALAPSGALVVEGELVALSICCLFFLVILLNLRNKQYGGIPIAMQVVTPHNDDNNNGHLNDSNGDNDKIGGNDCRCNNEDGTLEYISDVCIYYANAQFI